MKLLKYIQEHKLLIHYLTLVAVICGIWVSLTIQREARPNVNFNRVNIVAAYPGASPSDIEELVIDPIEEKIAEVDGIDEYRSVSYVGAGSISVKIDDSYDNPEEIVDEIRRKVSEVNDLPIEVDDPIVTEAKATSIPVISLALYGKVSSFDFKLETEKLKDFLEKQEGVQSISSSGISDLQLQIITEPKKLDKFDVTINEILEKVASWTKQKPGGLFENNTEVANITIGEDLNEVSSLGDFIVRSNDSGKTVKLSDVSSIKYDLESLQTASFYEDKEAVLLTVVKKPFDDSIKVVDAIKLAIKDYEQELNKDLKIKVYNDQSIRIRNKLNIVFTNAISGLVLVLIILLVFLDWRSALVTSIGIPIAILGGMCVLFYLGQTLNSLVVVGMIIVLGMLVDDAIVVCENIYSYIEKGYSPKEAAIKGTGEIALPVIASVLTTVFAFFPIVFMKEIIGQFLRVIPITVIALLSISLIEALLVLPVHAEELMKVKKKKKKNFFNYFEQKYQQYLQWSINKRWFLGAILSVILVISGFQGKKIFEKFSLFPADGLEGLSVRIELAKNSPIHKTKEIVQMLSEEILTVSENTFENVYSNIGQVTTGGNSGSRQNGAHLAMLNIAFVSDADFIYKEKRILTGIREIVSEFGKRHPVKLSITLDRPGPPIGKPIQFQVASRDFSFGEQIIGQIKDQLSQINGVHSIETDLDGDSVKYRLKIDNERAISEGVDPQAISRIIFASSTGRVASEILKNNEKVEVLVSVKGFQDNPIEKILDLKVRNNNGQAVAVKSFVNIVKETGASSVQRLNGLRTITLFAEVDEKVITGKEANAQISPFINKLISSNKTISIVVGGGEKDRLNAVSDTMKLYGLAIILIFMVISLTFESVLYPFLVLTAIPMGLSGVVWSLVLHDKSLSIMGIIGVVGLSGVVVNVSIIYLKFVQDKIAQGGSLHDAIIEAGVTRLRPIIMTTLSTLIGLLPTIYGIGGVDTFVQPIALVLGWGLFVATILTLMFLPAIVSVFLGFKHKESSQ